MSIFAKVTEHCSVAKVGEINFHFAAVVVMQRLLKPTKWKALIIGINSLYKLICLFAYKKICQTIHQMEAMYTR